MVSPLASISGPFVKSCTVQEYAEIQDPSGEITLEWTDLPGHVGLKCSVDQGDGSLKGEMVRNNVTLTFTPLEVTLFNSYPAITTKHRAIIDGTVYNILEIFTDSLGYSTVLQVVSVC